MRSFAIATAAALVLTPCARANFVVAKPATTPAASSLSEQNEPSDATPATDGPTSVAPTILPQPAKPNFIVARGFGDQVPLRFAVRQIVPKAVKVSYGPGADPSATVDWKGGQGWNRVLLLAVKPLGYRLVMTHMAVEIRK